MGLLVRRGSGEVILWVLKAPKEAALGQGSVGIRAPARWGLAAKEAEAGVRTRTSVPQSTQQASSGLEVRGTAAPEPGIALLG